jgi:hypothetical protein
MARAFSLWVWTTWPSWAMVTHEGCSLGAPSTSTRQSRHWAGAESPGW